MIMRVENRRFQASLFAMMALMLLGAIAVSPASAAAQPVEPTVNEILVESYNCETGRMPVLTRVSNLPATPPDASDADGSNSITFTATYASGATHANASPIVVRASTAGEPPYTGFLSVFFNIPVTNPAGPAGDAVVSVEIVANVGLGGPGQGAIDNPVDTLSTVYTVACGPPLPPPPPTIGEIDVESYDCETGDMRIGVPATNLPPSPAGGVIANASFVATFTATYESGASLVNDEPVVVGSGSAGTPYTGFLYVFFTIPVTNPASSADDPVVSVEIFASVGPGGPGQGALDNPSDSTSTVYTVDCDGGSLVDSLVAALKRILRDILGR
ncbi:MAG: hypothetical protein H0U38_02200 [Chloroflexia bacterium]|nr:hypothetical protein [Chloroflexia bacterium]